MRTERDVLEIDEQRIGVAIREPDRQGVCAVETHDHRDRWREASVHEAGLEMALDE
jgi:hypothetical protein